MKDKMLKGVDVEGEEDGEEEVEEVEEEKEKEKEKEGMDDMSCSPVQAYV